MKDSFYERKSIPIDYPEKKNENNDCPDYVDADLAKAKRKLEEDLEKLSERRWWNPWSW